MYANAVLLICFTLISHWLILESAACLCTSQAKCAPCISCKQSVRLCSWYITQTKNALGTSRKKVCSVTQLASRKLSVLFVHHVNKVCSITKLASRKLSVLFVHHANKECSITQLASCKLSVLIVHHANQVCSISKLASHRLCQPCRRAPWVIHCPQTPATMPSTSHSGTSAWMGLGR
jgi:hypothetical protein